MPAWLSYRRALLWCQFPHIRAGQHQLARAPERRVHEATFAYPRLALNEAEVAQGGFDLSCDGAHFSLVHGAPSFHRRLAEGIRCQRVGF